MASLQGLPPLPKSLRGLLQAGSEQWKETEKIHHLRTSIQQDLVSPEPNTATNGGPRIPSLPDDTSLYSLETRPQSNGARYPPGINKLGSAIPFLRREMIDLRQLDMSLLCQLWTLSENIQEYKNVVHERFSETNSTCSSHSLDNYPESLDVIEENDFEHDSPLTASKFRDSKEVENIYENASYPKRNVNLSNHYDRIRTPEIKLPVILPIKDPGLGEPVYEPMYLEPVPSPYREVVIPSKRTSPALSTSSKSSNSPGSQKISWTTYPYNGHNTTYESTC